MTFGFGFCSIPYQVQFSSGSCTLFTFGFEYGSVLGKIRGSGSVRSAGFVLLPLSVSDIFNFIRCSVEQQPHKITTKNNQIILASVGHVYPTK